MGAIVLAHAGGGVAARRRLMGGAFVLAITAVLVGVLLAYAPNFFSIRNLLNVLIQGSSLGVMAIGLTFVMIVGGIDLSIPATMAFAAVLGAFVMPVWGIVAGVATMLVSGLAVGAFNGVAVARFEMTPFVVTLASMTVIGGATVWMTNSQSLSDFPDQFFDLFLSAPAGVPVAVFILAVIAAIATLILSSTAYGRSLYAVGLNAKAARLARAPVEWILFSTYAISGLLAGVAAVMLTARLGSASANLGSDGVVLDIVTACVVGGVSIYGGAGLATGAVLGALFVTLISNSLNQLGVSYFMNLVVKGIAIILFIWIDRISGRASR
jgi:ribose/xylose/arabinose/galactoside ABC-type transport system permease subunit